MAEPMYRVIASDLQWQIETGRLAPGAQLKTEVELREDYGKEGMPISRTTVRDAIKLLVARGLVETRPGQGTFVVTKLEPILSRLVADPEDADPGDTIFQSEAERHGRKFMETRPRVEIQLAPADLAANLGLNGDEAQVISRHQERLMDRMPYSMQTTYYPMDFIARGATRLLEARDIEGGVIEYLRSLGIYQVGWRDRFSVRPPNVNEQAFFGLSDVVQVAMLEIHRTRFDQEGKPLALTVAIYAGDRNEFEMEAGKVPEAPFDLQ